MLFCPFSRYQYIRLQCGADPVEDIFHKKIDKLFSGMPHVYVVYNDILIAAFDRWCRNHNETL